MAALESLAPRYERQQHELYLAHLTKQVSDPRNLNIALTGRYGAGKSSILDEFERTHPSSTLRLSISTLDPSSSDSGLTNRIQKELVKQLLYRAPHRLRRHSRFAGISPLSLSKALLQSIAVVVLTVLALSFLGWMPSVAGTGHEKETLVRIGAWLGFGGLAAIAVTSVRLSVLQRRQISDLSAAGATVKLIDKEGTYFDEYLDEIVHFFDAELPLFVIFEDLDRFDDPHIFETLRELNTLLNSTDRRIRNRDRWKPENLRTKVAPLWVQRLRPSTPLRFIYAVKDSLFEQLGSDSAEAAVEDEAQAEVIRANRTKFFEIVIPVVPFISHRNARELLTDLVESRGLGVDRELVDLIAQHCTDMRLLRNICNEYEVFAARLLHVERAAPGISATKLFALVAYKNFHLADFEQISQRSSALDRLYDASRAIVLAEIDAREDEARSLRNGVFRAKLQRASAETLAARLTRIAQLTAGASSTALARFEVDGHQWDTTDISDSAFWKGLTEDSRIRLVGRDQFGNHRYIGTIEPDSLQVLFPESLKKNQWAAGPQKTDRERLAHLQREIAELRGADFQQLDEWSAFASDIDQIATSRVGLRPGQAGTFTEIAATALGSELARRLVSSGFIDRNFSLYAAQFYGHFTGVDVARFIVQHVQPNTMDARFAFDSDASIDNVLSEAPAGFTRTIAALNVSIVARLLETRDERASNIISTLKNPAHSEAADFMRAYLNDERSPDLLITALAAHQWSPLLGYVASDAEVPEDRRVRYFDAAIAGATETSQFEVDSTVGDFVAQNYRSMRSFREPQPERVNDRILDLLDRAGVTLPDVSDLADPLASALAESRLYSITAGNLRAVTGINGSLSLDALREHSAVYAYCCENVADYFAAIATDPSTPHAVETEETLQLLLDEQHESWERAELETLLGHASPSSALPDLRVAPNDLWDALADNRLFVPEARNFAAYLAHSEDIDAALGGYLRDLTEIAPDPTSETNDESLILAILNEAEQLPDLKHRVRLAASLSIDGHVDVGLISVRREPLLAHLLDAGLVPDARETFIHFLPAGWSALDPAIDASNNYWEFVDEALVAGMVPEFLSSEKTPTSVATRIVTGLQDFVPEDDPAALRAAASFAVHHGLRVAPDQLARCASAGVEAPQIVLLLHTADASAEEILNVADHLPEPYAQLRTRTKSTIRLPDDDAHVWLLEKLKAAGVVRGHKKRRLKPDRDVDLGPR